MSDIQSIIDNFIDSRKSLGDRFGVSLDFPVSILTHLRWSMDGDEIGYSSDNYIFRPEYMLVWDHEFCSVVVRVNKDKSERYSLILVGDGYDENFKLLLLDNKLHINL